MSELAGAAVRNLSDSAKQIEEDRRLLKDRRREQEVALGKLNRERQLAQGRFSAFVAAEKNEQKRRQRKAEAAARKAEAAARKAEAAAARAAQRASRSALARGPAPGPSFPGRSCAPSTARSNGVTGSAPGGTTRATTCWPPAGTENVATVPGTIESRFWGGGGLTLFLTGDDGHTYVYMHLLRVVGDQPRHVEAGELIGLMGASGNASAYHTHFEFHPGGGGAVDPHPLLVANCPPMPRDH